MEKIKNIFIGFGKGAKTLANKLATAGEDVLMIEQSEKMYGGTCINVACIPSKALRHSAGNDVNFDQAINDKTELVNTLNQNNYDKLANKDKAEVWTGKANFTSNHTLKVDMQDGDVREVEGERIFINTGSLPNIPDIEGVKTSQKIVDSEGIMELPTLAEELVIVGGGYIGIEFASMFAEFGSKVTVLDSNDDFLKKEDRDIAAEILDDMEDQGVEFIFGAQASKIEDTNDKVAVSYRQDDFEKTVTADIMLLATGRHANTDGLTLENTDIQLTDRGEVVVDDYLRTTVDNVWAMGDVKGGPQFTYISLDDHRIVYNQLNDGPDYSLADRNNVPYTLFVNPSLGRVGLTEEQAKSQGYDTQIFTKKANTVPNAKVLQEQRGMFKVIVDKETQLILGAAIYAKAAQELINMITLAMNQDIPYTVLRDQIYTHPTMAEAFNELFA